MKFKANVFERKCSKAECECRNCSFNGVEGMCLGCIECFEHKTLAPVSKCSIIKKGSWSGFGAIALRNSYLISIPMGICDVPEYFYICKDEFDSFDEWKDDAAKLMEIERRENKRIT
jgi:hypothetical protein